MLGKFNCFVVLLVIIPAMRLQNPQKSRDVNPYWWKEHVIYMIYTPSFLDVNADGIGDVQGLFTSYQD